MKELRPNIRVVVEQPSSSFMFKDPGFRKIAALWKMVKYMTHLGLWGHDLMKCTHLQSNMDTSKKCERRATKEAKRRHRERMERKRARQIRAGRVPKVYYFKLEGKKFQGGPDLAGSAQYPQRFVTCLFRAWLQWRSQWSRQAKAA